MRAERKWRVRRMEEGREKSSVFDSRASADADAARLRAQLSDAGAVWCSLPANERTQLMQAYAESKRRGVDLASALRTTEPVKAIGPKLSAVIDELVAAKATAGRAKDYTSSLSTLLGQFADGRA